MELLQIARLRLSMLLAAAVVVAGAGICSSAAAQTPAHQRLERNIAIGRPYFVDFRAGLESITGHSYIVFGRVDARGRVISIQHAEIYPKDDDAGLFVGIFVPVRASVRVKDGDSTQETVVNYRRYLTAAEYGRMMQAIRKERRHDVIWSVWLFNCNDFTSNIAEALGLRTPSSLLLPHAYISALRLLNGRQD
jgi:hypothetical protein